MGERIPQSTAIRVPLQAFLSSDHYSAATGKTIAITISKNGGAYGNPSAGATNATEISDGSYYVDLSTTDTGTLGPLLVRGAVATVDDVFAVYDVVAATNGGFTALPAAAADAAGGLPISDAGGLDLDAQRADVAAILVDTGTTLDARIPAALVSGRMDASVGAMAANTLTATAIAADAITDAKVASDVTIASVTGAVGSVTARVTANTDQLAGQTVTAAAGVAFPASVASPTNITGGTITTVTNLTNAPTAGDLTATMKASVAASVWNAVRASYVAAGSFGLGAAEAVPSAAQNADVLLDRNLASGTDSGSSSYRTLRQAVRFLRNKWAISGTTLTVYKEDDATASWTGVVTSSSSSAPVTGNDPAS